MGWTYNLKELKTKQDFIDQLNEIKAYRNLEGVDFDFGQGLIKNELSYVTEEAYWKMDIQVLKEIINFWEWEYGAYQKKKRKYKINQYSKKQIRKNKLKILQSICWWTVCDRETHLERYYFAQNTKRFYKKYSNKIVRKNKNLNSKSNKYRKIFDYWNMIF